MWKGTSSKICGLNKILGQKFFGPENIFGPKKNFGPKKCLGPNKFLGPKKFLVPKKYLCQKNSGPENFFWPEGIFFSTPKNLLGPKKILGPKHFFRHVVTHVEETHTESHKKIWVDSVNGSRVIAHFLIDNYFYTQTHTHRHTDIGVYRKGTATQRALQKFESIQLTEAELLHLSWSTIISTHRQTDRHWCL